jgi:peptidoglycan hydrolase-like protein with peptidoglycan-binding domain
VALLSALLLAGCGGPPPPEAATSSPRDVASTKADKAPTRAEIAEIQRLLTEKGYEPGPVDGLFGRRTSAAIARYQRDQGLGRTGMATRELIGHLRGQPSTAPAVVAVEAAATGRYDVGERYVFAGGVTHDVVESAVGRVKWQTSDGESFIARPEIGLPAFEWQYGSWRGRNESTLDRQTPWPPARGERVNFAVRSEEWNTDNGKNAPRQAGELHWSCVNDGPGEVEVPAGRFAVDVIFCERWPVGAGDWSKRIWYYAPAIGHYVRRDDLDTAGLPIGSLELVAALPGGGKTVQKGLRGALRDTLSNRALNDPAVWKPPVGAGMFVIRVTRDFKGEAGGPCRAYTVSRTGTQPRRDFPAISCYDKKKKLWRVPGL